MDENSLDGLNSRFITPMPHRTLRWVQQTEAVTPAPSVRAETPISWATTTVRGTPTPTESTPGPSLGLRESIEASPAPTTASGGKGRAQKGKPKLKFSDTDLTLVFNFMISSKDDWGGNKGEYWQAVAKKMALETHGRLNMGGDSWSKKMKPIWEKRDIDRQLETGTEKRMDDYTMAADGWLDFLEEFKAEEKEAATNKKSEDDRAAGELARSNLSKTLGQKRKIKGKSKQNEYRILSMRMNYHSNVQNQAN